MISSDKDVSDTLESLLGDIKVSKMFLEFNISYKGKILINTDNIISFEKFDNKCKIYMSLQEVSGTLCEIVDQSYEDVINRLINIGVISDTSLI